MKPPRRLVRNDSLGVSEVVGTILILGMTVSLFAAIIIWVTSIPTPQAGIRLELDGQLIPLKDSSGNWAGVNVTITHRGGESMNFADTRIYLTITKASGAEKTEILRLKGTIGWGPNSGQPYGLIDGKDNVWNINERWSIANKTVAPTDLIRAAVIDISRSTILWSENILGPVGSHPPLFLEKWADGNPDTATIEIPQTGSPFVIYAKVTDEDGNLKTVNATLTIFYGSPDPCAVPQSMYDDGTNGDLVKGDGIWTLKRECMVPANLTWDGTIVLFSASDGTFVTTSRMTLRVVLGPGGNGGGGGNFTGRPPNLRYNGYQGYNIFNSSQWDNNEFAARETRTFKANEKVVVVVGSLLLKDARDRDTFSVYDPFGVNGQLTPVVYGTNKIPNPTTKPTNLQAFRFYKTVNQYNVFIYRFDLNNASTTGVNYYKNPVHPPYYWFARYPVTMDIVDSSGTRFNTTDSVNITDTNGYMRQFPLIETYRDSGFTQKTNAFRSTDSVYVAVSMFSVDATTDAVTFGSVQVRDFLGGVQVFKSFVNGRDIIPPLCPVTGACTAPGRALSVNGATITYRFMLNLSLTDGDPWIDGSQNYAFTISYVHDVDETYNTLTSQLLIRAALFRLDVVGGNLDTTGPAWGTHDYGYYYESLNALDKWRKTRFEYCGLPGAGACKNEETHAVAFLDGDNDGDLDIADSIKLDNNNAEINYYRRQLDFDGNVVFTKFTLVALSGAGIYCNDIATADITGDGLADIVCGMTDGRLIYFKNDGTWTSGAPSAFIVIDSTRPQAIWGVTIADFDHDGDKDIAVARTGGTVTYYLNLDGRGNFGTGGVTDRWFAEAEVTNTGTHNPDFLATFASDNSYEAVQEALKTEPAQTGNTTNPGFNTSAASWTYADWENGAQANGAWQAAGGNPGGLVYVQDNFVASQTVSGLWRQPFTVSGSTPYTATVEFDRKVSQIQAGATTTVYVFVDPTAGNPTVGQEVAKFSHTVTSGWIASGTISVASSKLPTAGTYYLKIAARTTNPGGGATATIVQFDNIYLNWTSTGGDASELEHYWRIQQMPNRPLSTYSFRFEAHRSAPTDGDFFAVAYATDVAGVDPTTGTYTTILWVNTTADLSQNYNFPTNLQSKVVWIRVIDTDHHVGNTTLDTLSVDQMYIDVTTSPIQPGSVITLPTTPGDAKAIDSDDQDGDGYYDVVVGTSNFKVYKLIGFAGGLQNPGGIFYTATAAISGIKLANITSAGIGLEIVISYGTNVRILSGNGNTGNSIYVLTPATGATINTLAAGDMDGDGDDDIVVGTALTGAALVYYRNLGGAGTNWASYDIEPLPLGTTIAILDIDLGDGSKSQYLGR